MFCCRCGPPVGSRRSAKQLPAVLCVPKQPLRPSTSDRNACSVALLISSAPTTAALVHHPSHGYPRVVDRSNACMPHTFRPCGTQVHYAPLNRMSVSAQGVAPPVQSSAGMLPNAPTSIMSSCPYHRKASLRSALGLQEERSCVPVQPVLNGHSGSHDPHRKEYTIATIRWDRASPPRRGSADLRRTLFPNTAPMVDTLIPTLPRSSFGYCSYLASPSRT